MHILIIEDEEQLCRSMAESDEELEDASEVFALPDGKYLIVEG